MKIGMAMGMAMGILGGEGAVPWYRAGGAPAPVAAYMAVGADDYAASKVNLANPGTFDLVAVELDPDWSAITGWKFHKTALPPYHAADFFETGITIANKNYTIIWSMNTPMDNYETYWGVLNAATYPDNCFAAWYDGTGHRLEFNCGNVAATSLHIPDVGALFQNIDTVVAMNINGIYINGLAASTLGSVGNPTPNTETLWISTAHYTGRGADYSDTYGYEDNGYMHAFAIYNSVLSPAQILAITDRIKNP